VALRGGKPMALRPEPRRPEELRALSAAPKLTRVLPSDVVKRACQSLRPCQDETFTMGSSAIAGWIAHIAFWALVLLGALSGELRARPAAAFLILWLAGMFGPPYIPYGAGLFSSFVAVLDVALVFIVFKGDVRLT
jgi:hypothetical protein